MRRGHGNLLIVPSLTDADRVIPTRTKQISKIQGIAMLRAAVASLRSGLCAGLGSHGRLSTPSALASQVHPPLARLSHSPSSSPVQPSAPLLPAASPASRGAALQGDNESAEEVVAAGAPNPQVHTHTRTRHAHPHAVRTVRSEPSALVVSPVFLVFSLTRFLVGVYTISLQTVYNISPDGFCT